MNKKGFTLIELLIVVVIIGILAAIAIPRFSQTRERAFVSSMQSDLRNLQTVQEQYYADPNNDPNFTYGTQAQILGASLFAASSGVTVTIAEADQNGWVATAEHDGFAAAGPHCAIAVGQGANPIFGDAASGQVVCNIPGVISPPAAAGEGEGGGGT